MLRRANLSTVKIFDSTSYRRLSKFFCNGRLIRSTPVGQPSIGGRPTQYGREVVHRGPSKLPCGRSRGFGGRSPAQARPVDSRRIRCSFCSRGCGCATPLATRLQHTARQGGADGVSRPCFGCDSPPERECGALRRALAVPRAYQRAGNARGLSSRGDDQPTVRKSHHGPCAGRVLDRINEPGRVPSHGDGRRAVRACRCRAVDQAARL